VATLRLILDSWIDTGRTLGVVDVASDASDVIAGLKEPRPTSGHAHVHEPALARTLAGRPPQLIDCIVAAASASRSTPGGIEDLAEDRDTVLLGEVGIASHADNANVSSAHDSRQQIG
jgi:hypothetical protein